MSVDQSVFQTLAAQAPDGIAICEARSGEWQVIYVNAALEQLTGYSAEALRGRNLRLLQAEDHDQEGLAKIRTALHEGTTCQT
ncbi:MAG: PAS domain S-box protein, partial [Steroidobacteraceae bacterium]